MFDDLNALFHESVLPSMCEFAEFQDGPVSGMSIDIRAAVSAATAIFHFREHFEPVVRTFTNDELYALCPDLELIGDISNAAKHYKRTRGKNHKISEAKDISEEIFVTTYVDEAGEYYDVRSRVAAKLNDGARVDVFNLCVSGANFWGEQLKAAGVVSFYKPFTARPAPGSAFLARGACRGMNFQLLKGVRWRQTFRLQRFDSLAGKSIPVDLTGKKVQFRIFKPAPITVDFKLTNDTTGQVHEFSIELSSDEASALRSLVNAKDREQFLLDIVREVHGSAPSSFSEINSSLGGLVEVKSPPGFSDGKESEGQSEAT